MSQVKTNRSRRYLVKPSHGLIEAGENVQVAVVLQQGADQDLELEYRAGDASEGTPWEDDRLLIQAAVVDEDWFIEAMNMGDVDKAAAVRGRWDALAESIKSGGVGKDAVMRRKLKVDFTLTGAAGRRLPTPVDRQRRQQHQTPAPHEQREVEDADESAFGWLIPLVLIAFLVLVYYLFWGRGGK